MEEETVSLKFMVSSKVLSDLSNIPHITIPQSKTILDLKNEIKKVNNVEVDRQVLLFGNKVLMNDQTVGDYKFKPSATLRLNIAPPDNPFTVFVVNGNSKYNFTVEQKTLVHELRNNIAKVSGIPVQNFTLRYGGREMMEFVHLAYYNVTPDSKIEMRIKTQAT